ncbi:MAG: hypothetical protein LUG18_10300 [Candidatus Azobacteroides sp.]|nr:hypothetical protein [Candidatus Azobacteroides sp.]
MKEFVIYTLKSGICLGIFLFVYRCFLRRMTFFGFNRIYLIVGLLLSFLLPLISFTYKVPVSSSYTFAGQNLSFIPEEAGTGNGTFSGWNMLFLCYLLGIFVILVRNIRSYFRLFRLIPGKIGSLKGCKIIDRKDIPVPFSTLNYVFINSEKLSEIEKNAILKHEITHVTQKHWIDLVISECALLWQWFNPLVWIYVHYQKENHEFLADKAVIAEGVAPAVYQAVLVNQQFRGPVFSFAHSFSYSKPLNRLSMMKKEKTSSWKKGVLVFLLPAFGVFFWASATPEYIPEGDLTPTITLSGEGLQINPPGKEIAGEMVIYIDDKLSTMENLEQFPPESIEVMNVIKEEAVLREMGHEGKRGMIRVYTKDYAKAHPEIVEKNDVSLTPCPLFILDGNIIPESDMQHINPDDIERIDVLKDQSAIAVYGEKGKNGVVVITLKKQAEENK